MKGFKKMAETRNFILAKRAATPINRQIINDRNRLNYASKRHFINNRTRIISVQLYDGRLYAKFNTPRAKIKNRMMFEYDSLWDKLISLESLISYNADKIMYNINRIEYLTI